MTDELPAPLALIELSVFVRETVVPTGVSAAKNVNLHRYVSVCWM